MVAKSFLDGNVLLVGMPAIVKKYIPDWYSSLDSETKRRVYAIENLKNEMGLI